MATIKPSFPEQEKNVVVYVPVSLTCPYCNFTMQLTLDREFVRNENNPVSLRCTNCSECSSLYKGKLVRPEDYLAMLRGEF